MVSRYGGKIKKIHFHLQRDEEELKKIDYCHASEQAMKEEICTALDNLCRKCASLRKDNEAFNDILKKERE